MAEKNQDYKESKKIDRMFHVKRYYSMKDPVTSDKIRYTLKS